MVTDMIKQLLEAGVHFGHQTKKWNPKMAPYIFGQRNGVYIIDLEKTVVKLEEACDFLRDAASKGESMLFVGTKKQAKDAIISESQRCEMFYVTERWLGGLLTNFATIRKSVKHMQELEETTEGDKEQSITKKERALMEKKLAKLQKNLSGVAGMTKLPGVVVVIDPKKEDTAVREARRLGIPIVSLIDTNSNPEEIDYPVPGNDDAIRAIRLVLTVLTDSILEGRKKFAEGNEAEDSAAAGADKTSESASVDKPVAADDEKQEREEDTGSKKAPAKASNKKTQAEK